MINLKLYEGFLEDYEKMRKDAIEKIKEIYFKFDINANIYLFDENESPYELETVYQTNDGSLMFEYFEWITDKSKKANTKDITKIPDDMLFEYCDAISSYGATEHEDYAYMCMDVYYMFAVMKEYNIPFSDSNFKEIVDNHDGAVIGNDEFQEYIIKKYPERLEIIKDMLSDNIKKKFDDEIGYILDGYELGLL